MNKWTKAAAWAVLAVGAGGAAYVKWNFRMPLKEYTQYALYMAMLDDEICGKEPQGNGAHGKVNAFSQTLQDRYHRFLRKNRRKSRSTLQGEIAGMERRLQTSRQYFNKTK